MLDRRDHPGSAIPLARAVFAKRRPSKSWNARRTVDEPIEILGGRDGTSNPPPQARSIEHLLEKSMKHETS